VVSTITIRELFKTAFKVQGQDPPNATPGQWYLKSNNTESQTVLDNISFNNALDIPPVRPVPERGFA
jgi:hypothetical protein